MIVVLTLGRSGSSLIMQTLNILGADVFGRSFNSKPSQSHIEMNPKGYYEDGMLYTKGLRSLAFEKLGAQNGLKLAFKTDLRNFVKHDVVDLWIAARNQISCVIVSIRAPCEQTRSEFLGSILDGNDKISLRQLHLKELRWSVEFLQSYRQCFHALQERLDGPLSNFVGSTHAVDYAQALINPEAYVRRIARCASLEITDANLARAITNIELGLYRNKEKDLCSKQGVWAKQTGAQMSFERTKRRLG